MTIVSMADDAALLTPAEMSARLAELTAGGDVTADYYGNGGAVEAFEAKIAKHLGKERAVIFPTGTLANLCAMRLLAGPDHARILTHRKSHFFNDSGDNLSAVGRYTMVPLGASDAGYEASEVQAEIARAANARVATRIGCITVESPSRQVDGRRFGAERIAEIGKLARANNIPMFLDGARMLIECAVTGQDPADVAAPFDLVYVSLYKYLDAPFGCVLAGDSAPLENLFHDRRRYGGGMWQMWPAAVMAGAKLDGFADLWARTLRHADEVFDALDPSVRITRFEDGTNSFRLHLPQSPDDPADFKARALENGVKILPFTGDTLTLKINDSWLARPPADLAQKLKEMTEW